MFGLMSKSSPFISGSYKGAIDISIFQKGSVWVHAEGKRVYLEPFQGEFQDRFREIFGEVVQSHLNEFEDMKEIFSDIHSRKLYGNGQTQTDLEIEKRINFNAKRAFEGNAFTGFAAIEKTTQKIIGFVSIGRGFQKGDSQSALILNSKYMNRHYGSEIALLAGCLAYVYFKNSFSVGTENNKVPVKRFTATALDSHEQSIKLIQKMGMKKAHSLSTSLSSQPKSLYVIEGGNIEEVIKKFIDLKSLHWKIIPLI